MSGAAIISQAMLTPLGNRPEEILQRMFKGERALRDISGFDCEGYVHKQAGEIQDFRASEYLGKKGLRALDRTGKFAAAACGLALSEAGMDKSFREQNEIALVLGTQFCGAGTIAAFDQRGLELGPEYVSPIDFANTVINAAAGQVAIRYNLRGTNSTTAGGCCAGLKALAYARDLLAFGREQHVLAGGAEELSEYTFSAYDKSPYLAGGEMFPSEGAAFAVLVPPKHLNGQVNGRHALGYVVDHVSRVLHGLRARDCAAEAIRQLLAANQLESGDIAMLCLSAHGYEPVDKLEQEIVTQAFNPMPPLFSPKYWLGEGFGLSGIAQLVLSLEAMKQGRVPLPGGGDAALDKAPTYALLLGFSFDGLFDAVLIKSAARE